MKNGITVFLCVTATWWISARLHSPDMDSYVKKVEIQNKFEAREMFYEGMINDVDSVKYKSLHLNAKVQLKEIRMLKNELLK